MGGTEVIVCFILITMISQLGLRRHIELCSVGISRSHWHAFGLGSPQLECGSFGCVESRLRYYCPRTSASRSNMRAWWATSLSH